MGEKGNDPAAAAAGISSRLTGGAGSGLGGSMEAMQQGSQQLEDMKSALESQFEPPKPGS